MDTTIDRISSFARRHWWVGILLAITLVGTLARGRSEHYESPGAWAGVLAAIAVLALLVRHDRPEVTVLVNAAAVAGYFAAGFPDGPIYLSVFCSLFAIAARRPVRAWAPYVAVVLVVLGGAQFLRPDDDIATIGVAVRTTWFLAVCGAALAIGMANRSRRAAHTEQVRRAASEEQLRMAQDLHDGVGHGLAVIAMQAGVGLHVLDRDPEAARAALSAIREQSQESLAALRAEISGLTGGPAPRAPRRDLSDLPELVSRVQAAGVAVRRVGSAPDERVATLPAEVSEAAYGIVQEAVTNVLRHADAQAIEVSLDEVAGTFVVTVSDDGRGAAGPPSGQDEGMGIRGMHERAASVGGRLAAGPLPEGGFRVQAHLPVRSP